MPNPVPFNDLGRAVEADRAGIAETVERVLASGWFVLGPEHDAFEVELGAALGGIGVAGVGNGTDALQLALAAVGVVRDSVVVSAANAGGYTAAAAASLGARLAWADVDPMSLLVDVGTVAAAVERADRRPAAIVVTHLFGAAAPVDEIVAWARPLGIPVIEDCAQAVGAVLHGRPVGTIGDAATASFYPTKNLGAVGDGGAVLSADPDLIARVRRLRQYGWGSKYRVEQVGGRNSRLDELQAAVLRRRLPGLADLTERRRAVHRAYETALVGADPERIRLVNRASPSFAAHLAVLDVDDREAARAALAAEGIATDVHYPVPDHRQAVAEGDRIELPVTERAADRILSVPLFPELRDDEVERVSAVLAALGRA